MPDQCASAVRSQAQVSDSTEGPLGEAPKPQFTCLDIALWVILANHPSHSFTLFASKRKNGINHMKQEEVCRDELLIPSRIFSTREFDIQS